MDLPLRVLVAAVVAGITVLAVLGGLGAAEGQQAVLRAEAAIDAVVRLAQRFYLAGGGGEELRVDLGGGVTAKVEYVRIGDVPGGAWASAAAYRVTGQPETYVVADPPVPMAGDGGPMVLGPGLHRVRIAYDGEGPVRLEAA